MNYKVVLGFVAGLLTGAAATLYHKEDSRR